MPSQVVVCFVIPSPYKRLPPPLVSQVVQDLIIIDDDSQSEAPLQNQEEALLQVKISFPTEAGDNVGIPYKLISMKEFSDRVLSLALERMGDDAASSFISITRFIKFCFGALSDDRFENAPSVSIILFHTGATRIREEGCPEQFMSAVKEWNSNQLRLNGWEGVGDLRPILGHFLQVPPYSAYLTRITPPLTRKPNHISAYPSPNNASLNSRTP